MTKTKNKIQVPISEAIEKAGFQHDFTLGQKAKGIRFTSKKNSSNMYWDQRMEEYVGREGFIVEIVCESILGTPIDNYITIRFECIPGDYQPKEWCYPIKEYLLSIKHEIREERLNELGI
jgi:hypothetical protein